MITIPAAPPRLGREKEASAKPQAPDVEELLTRISEVKDGSRDGRYDDFCARFGKSHCRDFADPGGSSGNKHYFVSIGVLHSR
jgi:hypothetical protein